MSKSVLRKRRQFILWLVRPTSKWAARGYNPAADPRPLDLRWANLSGADLRWANLSEANLSGADLNGADLDFAAWPLWCGTFCLAKTDDRLTAQLVRHTLEVAAANGSEYGLAVVKALSGPDRFHTFRQDIKPLSMSHNSPCAS